MEDFRFDEKTHTYYLGDKILPSVTQIIESTITKFEKKYENVNEEILKRAAEKGRLIHSEIEAFVKRDFIGFTTELTNFINIVADKKLSNIQSEVKVYNNEFAGTIDIIAEKGISKRKNILADIKTTYKIDKEYISWQLSLYNYLLEYSKPDLKIDEFYVIWLRDEDYKFEKIEPKSKEEILNLLDCYKKGVKIDCNTNTLQTIPQDKQIQFCNLFKQMKAIEEKSKEIKEAILKEMEERNIDIIEIDDIRITRKATYVKTSVDSNKLKEDGLYEKYTKTSNVKSSILINIKK